jgi:Alpha/beta hydrolase domain
MHIFRRIGFVFSGLVGLAVPVAVTPVAASPAAGSDVTPFTVSTPAVTGPIPSTPTDFPFIADGFGPEPPVPAGYMENEYFASGQGNLYEYTPTGIQIVTPCPASAEPLGCTDIPYTTRMLVKQPSDPRKFSGTVVVEPLNPSAGYDIAAVWDRSWPYFVRSGDIFVGWTSRYVTINTLKQWNPTRYAPLRWGQNSAVDDGITFDIAAQIGALFKTNGVGSPTHALKVKHVFEAGFSQDGGFTFTQADVFNAVERLPDGGPVYDGYIPGGTTGPSNIDFGLTPAGALPPGDPRHQMQPRDVPVIQINTETEEAALAPAGLTYRRSDSDAPGDRYRLWEVPGASHVSNDLNTPSITLQRSLAELQGIPVAELAPVGCTHLQFVNGPSVGVPGVVDPNTYPFSNVANAAFADLTKWIDEGVPPPHASFIEVTNTAPAMIIRDAFGNALGGVRTPFVDVPTATYSPTDTVAHTTLFSGFCVLYGYNIPFSQSTLRSLYPNHGDYVAAVARESNLLVHEGFWLRPDAQQVITQAARSDVP